MTRKAENRFESFVKGQRVRNVDREMDYRVIEKAMQDKDLSDEFKNILRTFFETYRTKYGKPLSYASQRNYLMLLRAFYHFLAQNKGVVDLQDVTRLDIDNFFVELSKEQSDRTIQNYRIYHRAFFRWYYIKYLAPKDNNREEKARLKDTFDDLFEDWRIDNKSIQSTPVKDTDLITEQEFTQMMKHAGSVRNQAILMMLRESGARIGEVQNLRIQDITMTARTCDVSVIGSKDRQERVIPIPECRPYLLAWLKVHPDSDKPDMPLWISRKGQVNPLSKDRLRRIVRETAKKAGITRRIHPHLFRHNRLTELAVEEDIPLSLIKEISGHASTTILEKIYVQSSQRKARERIYQAKGIEINGQAEKKEPDKECPTCYQKNKANARFCSRCGSPMDLVSAMVQRQSQKDVGLLAQAILNNPELRKQLAEEMKTLEG